jgi:hypothetical protein
MLVRKKKLSGSVWNETKTELLDAALGYTSRCIPISQLDNGRHATGLNMSLEVCETKNPSLMVCATVVLTIIRFPSSWSFASVIVVVMVVVILCVNLLVFSRQSSFSISACGDITMMMLLMMILLTLVFAFF